MSYSGVLGSNFEKPFSYFESAPSNLVDPLIWYQKCLSWVFLGWNLKVIKSYLKSAPSNSSNCKILRKKITKISKFGIKNTEFGILG